LRIGQELPVAHEVREILGKRLENACPLICFERANLLKWVDCFLHDGT